MGSLHGHGASQTLHPSPCTAKCGCKHWCDGAEHHDHSSSPSSGAGAVAVSPIARTLFSSLRTATPRHRGVMERRDHCRKDGIKHDEGRSSLQRKLYIAYDLLSANIKQFNQPTLNHSDSFTLPTNLCSRSSSSVLPTSPPHFLVFKRFFPHFFPGKATHICAHACREVTDAHRTPRGTQSWRWER